MSIFGFISMFIAVVSVAAIVLHYKIMKRRAPVDIHMEELEELMRQRQEQESPEEIEVIENTISEAITILNTAITEYNTYIAKDPTIALMAKILGLSQEESIQNIHPREDDANEDDIPLVRD
ncbi:MAG: LemA family protein [Defluviitaleaceae bacterium]|nr:LemA family protein [Defluviitaleaceae bacterium]